MAGLGHLVENITDVLPLYKICMGVCQAHTTADRLKDLRIGSLKMTMGIRLIGII